MTFISPYYFFFAQVYGEKKIIIGKISPFEKKGISKVAYLVFDNSNNVGCYERTVEFDDYDRLIQLCDSLAGGESIMTIEERMNDVKNRYGFYPESKWNKNLEIKAYFEQKIGKDIYSVIGKN